MRPLPASTPVSYAALMAALLALAVALGGTAYAVTKAPANSVVTKSIKNNAVTGTKIKDGNVTGADIASGAVTGAEVADGSLTGADLANGSVGAPDLDPAVGGLFLPASRVVPIYANATECATEASPGCESVLATFGTQTLELGCSRIDSNNTRIEIRGTADVAGMGLAGILSQSKAGEGTVPYTVAGNGTVLAEDIFAFEHGSATVVVRDATRVLGSVTLSFRVSSQGLAGGTAGPTCLVTGSAVVF